MLGELLTRWSIRLALACLVACLAGRLATRHPNWPRISRGIWTLGCGLFLLHVVCAFHFYHHWSHLAAWQSTAEETERLLGVALGDGIYASYLFLVLWVADVVWLWTAGSRPVAPATSAISVPEPTWLGPQTPLWRVLVHVFLWFIAFNGAIVFEAVPTRWVGIVACLALAFLAGRRAYNFATAKYTPATALPSQAAS